MSTIGNMPGADVYVEFPSGDVKVVNLIILLVQTQFAESIAKFGVKLAPNGPTLADLREMYEIPSNVRTWAHMAELLRMFYNDLRVQAEAAIAAQNN